MGSVLFYELFKSKGKLLGEKLGILLDIIELKISEIMVGKNAICLFLSFVSIEDSWHSGGFPLEVETDGFGEVEKWC